MDSFAFSLLQWFAIHGRTDLPWQQPRTAYRVWLSEIMLQQTRVQTVIPYFQRFIQHFDNIAALAAAPLDEVLHLWSGLGYYQRARNIHATAQRIMQQHRGVFPSTMEELVQLPGIGNTTAAAIVSQVWQQREAIVDANVKRVLARYHQLQQPLTTRLTEQQLLQYARSHLPESERMADYTQAIMDLGALICHKNPQCDLCPVQHSCLAYQNGLVAEIPLRTGKNQRRVKQQQILCLQRDDGAVLLHQRAPTGVWGGLWSLPELPNGVNDPRSWLQQQFGIQPRTMRQLPLIVHQLSHFQWQLQPLLVEIDTIEQHFVAETSPQCWYLPHQNQKIGLPAPVEKLLYQLFTL